MLKLDAKLIAGLRSLLDDLHYDAVQRSLRPNYFAWPFPALEPFQQLLVHLPERQRVSYEVLLLGQPARRERLERAWGADAVRELLELGLLELEGTMRIRTANYSVVSFLGRYFVVTLNPYYPGSRDPDASIYIGPDSLTLAAYLAGLGRPNTWTRALDLCTGSGIQAIFLAATTTEVIAVELNEQAVHAARFNALLNGVAERIHVYQGNLYEPVPAGLYDVIVSNPPFIPVPPQVRFAMCGHGGEDGLVVLRPLLEGIPSRLAENGQAIIYAEGVGDAQGPFVRNVLQKLAGEAKLDISILLVSRLSAKGSLVLKAFQLSKLKRPSSELAQWRELYERLGTTHLYNYILHIRRGRGSVDQIPAFNPHLEERGLEVQPGVVIKPR